MADVVDLHELIISVKDFLFLCFFPFWYRQRENITVLYDDGEKKVHSQLAESQNHLVFRRMEHT